MKSIWQQNAVLDESNPAVSIPSVWGSYDIFYQLQRDDGYISMTYDFDTGKEPYPDRINPPLFAWGEWEYYRSTGDASRFTHAVPHIEKLMDWIDLPGTNLAAEIHNNDGTATYSLQLDNLAGTNDTFYLKLQLSP